MRANCPTGPGQNLARPTPVDSGSTRLPGTAARPVTPLGGRLLLLPGAHGVGEGDVGDEEGGQGVLLHLSTQPEAVTAVHSELRLERKADFLNSFFMCLWSVVSVALFRVEMNPVELTSKQFTVHV